MSSRCVGAGSSSSDWAASPPSSSTTPGPATASRCALVTASLAHHVAQVVAGELGLQPRQRLGVGRDDRGVGVLDEVAEVVALVEVADRDGDRADAHGAEEHDREGGGVVEHEQHAVLAADAELPQQPAGAVDLLAQLLVGERRVLRDERRLVGPPGLDMAVDDAAGVVGHARLTTTDFLSV